RYTSFSRDWSSDVCSSDLHRSATMPSKPGMKTEALPMVEYTDPICNPENPSCPAIYLPSEMSHEPHTKNWRKFITINLVFIDMVAGKRLFFGSSKKIFGA